MYTLYHTHIHPNTHAHKNTHYVHLQNYYMHIYSIHLRNTERQKNNSLRRFKFCIKPLLTHTQKIKTSWNT